MTEHVRTNYRNHRKATWGLAIALVVAIAAVVIPIASGASDKTYTMLFPSTGAVTPTPPTSGNTNTRVERDVHREGGDHEHRQVLRARFAEVVPRERDPPSAVARGITDGLADLEGGNVASTSAPRFERRGHDCAASAPVAPQRCAGNPLASSSRTTSPTPARTRTRTGSTTRRSRRSASRRARRPSPDACTTTVTRAARSRSTPRRRRATS